MVASDREQNSDNVLRCHGKQANHELAYAYESMSMNHHPITSSRYYSLSDVSESTSR